uniref:Rab3 GTPase-activating protein catalytic subunit n=1 Tax=Parastrongyloides trichosuri TaxID=131310 RepID=A0A0N4Z7X6_PARTI
MEGNETPANQFHSILKRHGVSNSNQSGCVKRVYLGDKIKWTINDDIVYAKNGNFTVSFMHLSSFPIALNDAPVFRDEKDDRRYFEIDLRNVTDYYGDMDIHIEKEMSFTKAFGIYGLILINTSRISEKLEEPIFVPRFLRFLKAFDKKFGSCIPVFVSKNREKPWDGRGMAFKNGKKVELVRETTTSDDSFKYLDGLKESFIRGINFLKRESYNITGTALKRYTIFEEDFWFSTHLSSVANSVKNGTFIESLEKHRNTFKLLPLNNPLYRLRLYCKWYDFLVDLTPENKFKSNLTSRTNSEQYLDVLFNGNIKSCYLMTMERMLDCYSAFKNTNTFPFCFGKIKKMNNLGRIIRGKAARDLAQINKSNSLSCYAYELRAWSKEELQSIPTLAKEIAKYVFQSFDNGEKVINDIPQVKFGDKKSKKTENWKSRLLEECELFKSSKSNSLAETISVVVAKCLSTPFKNSFELAAYVWDEFVKIIKEHFEECKDLPGIESNSQACFNYCVLHNHLQYLQYCIEQKRKIRNYKAAKTLKDFSYNTLQPIHNIGLKNKSDTIRSAERAHPVAGNVILINNEERIIFKPFFNPKSSVTEIDAHKKILKYRPFSKSSTSGANKQLLLQSKKGAKKETFDETVENSQPKVFKRSEKETSNVMVENLQPKVYEYSEKEINELKYNIGIFKALNPECEFLDFVKEYCPNDVKISEDKKLNSCLQIWQTTWNDTPPLPIIKEDLIAEVQEKFYNIVGKLQNVTVSGMINFIAPCFIKVAFKTLVENVPINDNFSKELLYDVRNHLNDKEMNVIGEGFQTKFYKHIRVVHNRIIQYNYLKEIFVKNSSYKLSSDALETVENFVVKFLYKKLEEYDDHEPTYFSRRVPIPIKHFGNIALLVSILTKKMSKNDGNSDKMPEPDYKEYILKYNSSDKSFHRRIFSVVDGNEVSAYLSSFVCDSA